MIIRSTFFKNLPRSKAFALFLTITLLFSCQKKIQETCCNPVIQPTDPCTLGEHKGVSISYQNTRAQVDAIGAESIHFWIQWYLVEKEIVGPFFKVEDITEAMIQAYSSGLKTGVNWTFLDAHFQEFQNLNLIIGIGSGWEASLPSYNGEKLTPDAVGRDNYLGLLYLYTRSCVRRYGSKVIGWQIENEPNVAPEMVLFGLRKGSSWSDVEFMTEVLETLESAVMAEDPDAWITINFHTDIHYEADIKRWLYLVDMVSIDAYPNYFNGYPVQSQVVLDRLTHAIGLAEGKPVFIMETGYASAPAASGFSEENQRDFIDTIYSNYKQAGGCGAFFFKLSSPEQLGSATYEQQNYSGLIRLDSSYKPAWHVLKKHLE